MSNALEVPPNGMIGKQDSTTYYFANLQPALAAAYELDARTDDGFIGPWQMRRGDDDIVMQRTGDEDRAPGHARRP